MHKTGKLNGHKGIGKGVKYTTKATIDGFRV